MFFLTTYNKQQSCKQNILAEVSFCSQINQLHAVDDRAEQCRFQGLFCQKLDETKSENRLHTYRLLKINHLRLSLWIYRLFGWSVFSWQGSVNERTKREYYYKWSLQSSNNNTIDDNELFLLLTSLQFNRLQCKSCNFNWTRAARVTRCRLQNSWRLWTQSKL